MHCWRKPLLRMCLKLALTPLGRKSEERGWVLESCSHLWKSGGLGPSRLYPAVALHICAVFGIKINKHDAIT
jgi:hypothetical protein